MLRAAHGCLQWHARRLQGPRGAKMWWLWRWGGVLMVAGAAEFLVWNAMLTCATCSSSKFA